MPDKEDVGPSAQTLYFPPFRLDLATEQLRRGTELLAVRPKTFAVLRYLVEHAGRLVTREELCQAVWPKTVGSERAPKQCIRELRQLLGEATAKPHFIETLARRGWRFIAKVDSSQQSVDSNGEQCAVRRPTCGVKTSQPSFRPSPPSGGNPHSTTTTLVGREPELSQLHRRFEMVMNAERQIVFVTGEPGIGKTTLVDAFLHSLTNQGLWVGHGQCIEQHGSGEAFLPVLDALGRLVCGAEGARLIEILRTYAPMWLIQLPALIDGEELETLQHKVQGASRERMLREMAEALERLAAERPVTLMLEDLHWIDVSTLDLLAFLARRKEPARLLVIGTYRPVEMLNDGHPLQSITQELYAHRLATELPLQLLREADIAAYLDIRLRGGARHTSQLSLAQLLHQRTGGNPLFLVSTVQELVSQGLLIQTDHSWTLQGEVADVGIAESIRHLIARQRARLSAEECQTLEAASVAGMEFSAAAVAAALTTETVAIERHCEQLAERQHFLRRVGVEAWPDGTLAARYGFLHAVYQQLWHERVTPTQLQQQHLRIGERKEQAYGEQVREIAGELAVHFEQGRDYRKAVQYLELGARSALRRSAYHEGLGLLNKGLTLLKTLPDTIEHAQQELRLQMMLTTPLIALRGYTIPEVEQAYLRAQTLCAQIGEHSRLFSVLSGLCFLHYTRGQLRTAFALAQQLLGLAQKTQERHLLLWAHYMLGLTLENQGDLHSARTHLEQSLTLYEFQEHPAVYGFVQNPGSTGLARLAWILYSLGYPDQAWKKISEALTVTRRLGHSFSLAPVLMYAAEIHYRRGEDQIANELEVELSTLARAHGFSHWSTEGALRRAWTLARQGQRAEGLVQLRQTVSTLYTRREEITHPYIQHRLAAAYGQAGEPEEGLRLVATALGVMQREGRILWEAHFSHLKGELILQQEGKDRETKSTKQKSATPTPHSPIPDPHSEAEACFIKSIEILRKQQARSFELRATMSLARLWQRQGKTKQAHKLLSEIYNWFTEGFDTKDLQEAKALIEELSD